MSRLSWLAAVVVLVGCGGETTGEGVAPGTSQAELSADEAASLQWMREEEKLARDVYLALGRRWSAPIFANIASSEQRHMDSVGALLVSYGLVDPSAGRGEGDFADAQLQSLFTQLMAQGERSLTDALIVGATIEDLDIADLTRLSAQISQPDILSVYGDLTRGSRNHLRSFTGQLTAQGVSYSPQFIDAATYEAILSSPSERGPGLRGP